MKSISFFAVALLAVFTQAHAEKYTATFQSITSSDTFKVTFDDAINNTNWYDASNPTPEDIGWQINNNSPYFKDGEFATANINQLEPNTFAALSVHSASGGIPAIMDYRGTPVHVLISGTGTRVDILRLTNFDFTTIDTSKPGWSLDFYTRASTQLFSATLSYRYEVFAAYVDYTDGPITVQEIYSGGPWFDGIPIADARAAFDQQYPDFNKIRTESMRLVSITAVPEPESLGLAIAGMAILGASCRFRNRTDALSNGLNECHREVLRGLHFKGAAFSGELDGPLSG